MIRQITIDDFGEIEDLLDVFVKQRETGIFQPQVPFKDQIRNGLESERIIIFAKYYANSPVGFIVLSPDTSMISVLYVDESAENIATQERELFNFGFDHLTQTLSNIKIGGRQLGTTLNDYFETKGFRRYDRKHMTLSRRKIELLPEPILPEGYSFETYEEDRRGTIADIVYISNINNIDVNVFPEFFGTLDASTRLLENIEQDRYGKYKHPHSRILMHDGNEIGACFLTMTADDTGYIPDICVLQAHRGKGLGKLLLVYSMKEMVKLESDLVKINLDVTKENPAKNLYESLGYEDVNHYSMYSWNKEE